MISQTPFAIAMLSIRDLTNAVRRQENMYSQKKYRQKSKSKDYSFFLSFELLAIIFFCDFVHFLTYIQLLGRQMKLMYVYNKLCK